MNSHDLESRLMSTMLSALSKAMPDPYERDLARIKERLTGGVLTQEESWALEREVEMEKLDAEREW